MTTGEATLIQLMCDVLKTSDHYIMENTADKLNWSALTGVDLVRKRMLSSLVAMYPEMDKRRLEVLTTGRTPL